MEHVAAALVTAAFFCFVVWGLFRLLVPKKSKPMVCTTCGEHGQPIVKAPGSFGMEVLLWLLFIVPGVLYSIWRLAKRGHVCPSCGASTLVPPTSPVGQRFIKPAQESRP
jgi:predicted RNA-binding Zn-ribbon protein involved in translation (DUF1610 family)